MFYLCVLFNNYVYIVFYIDIHTVLSLFIQPCTPSVLFTLLETLLEAVEPRDSLRGGATNRGASLEDAQLFRGVLWGVCQGVLYRDSIHIYDINVSYI